MNNRALTPIRPIRLGAICFAAFLAGCGSVNLWPFGSESKEMSRKPTDATEYQCSGGNVFYVRNLDANAVWLIAPDRQIRLERATGSTAQIYGAGKVRLEISGRDATLVDPPAQFLGCKRADAKS